MISPDSEEVFVWLRVTTPRPPTAAGCGVDDPEVDHGEETRGGSGSYVKIEAIIYGLAVSQQMQKYMIILFLFAARVQWLNAAVFAMLIRNIEEHVRALI